MATRPLTSADQRGPVHAWPALDGIRGAAVAAVLVYHQGFGWARGGFLGVSAFFTLSGFLIATLLLTEHAKTGAIALRRFWVRRARRLVPASLLTLAGILVFIAVVVPESQRAADIGDVRAALGFVVNWRLVATQSTYAAVVSDPSPLQHYWSLAIEEQFYLLFPLLVALCLRRSRATLAAALVALTVASVAMQHVVGDDRLRSYYGTDTRAAELLIGALLAVWFVRTSASESTTTRRRWADGLGAVAMALTLTLWVFARQDSGWLYAGGLVGVAATSAALIHGATRGRLVPRVLGIRPLTWLGKVSYAVYLFHWPIFLWLTPERTGLGFRTTFVVRVVTTLAAAALSFRLLEWPIRRGTALPGRRALLGAAVAGVVLVVVSVPIGAAVQPSQALADIPPGAFRILVVGDSTATRWVLGLRGLSDEAPAVAVFDATKLGCGLLAGRSRLREGWEADSVGCTVVDDAVTAGANFRPDVVLLSTGYGDLSDWQLPGDQQWRHLGDPTLDDAYRAAVRAALSKLSTIGAPIVFLDIAPPHWVPEAFAPGTPVPGSGEATMNDPARAARMSALNQEVAAAFPLVEIGPYAAHLAEQEGSVGPDNRSVLVDGLHLLPNAARDLFHSWLEAELVQAAAKR